MSDLLNGPGQSGRVDWAPGQIRDSDDDKQPCPDCDTEGAS